MIVCNSLIGRLFVDGKLVNQSAVRFVDNNDVSDIIENYGVTNLNTKTSNTKSSNHDVIDWSFLIGSASAVGNKSTCVRRFLLDEFNYWSEERSADNIDEGGVVLDVCF